MNGVTLLLWLLLLPIALGCGGARGSGLAGPGEGAAAVACEDAPDGDGGQLVIQDGHSDRIASVALSHDGHVLASIGLDGTARIWDARTGLLVRRFKSAKSLVSRVQLSAAGDVLAYPVDDPTPQIVLVDLGTGQEVRRLPFFRGFALSPDGRRIAIIATEGVTLFDVATGAPMAKFERMLGADDVAFDPTGRRLLVAGGPGVTFLNAATLAIEREVPITPAKPIDTGALSADVAVVRGTLNEVHLIGPSGPRTLPGQFGAVALQGDRVFTAGAGVMMHQVRQGLRMWDARTGKALQGANDEGPVDAIAVSGDGSTLALVKNDISKAQGIRIVDTASMRTVRRLEGAAAGVEMLAFAPGGESLLTASQVAIARFSLVTGELQGARPPESSLLGGLLAFDPKGSQLFVGNGLNMVHVYDAEGRLLRRFLPNGPKELVHVAALGPGGQDLYTAGRDGVIKSWKVTGPVQPAAPAARLVADIARPPERTIVKLPWPIIDGVLTPDGATLVVGGFTGWELAAVDVQSGKVKWQTIAKTTSPRALLVTKSGKVLISARGAAIEGGELFVHSLVTGELERTVALPTFGRMAIQGDALVVGGEHPVLVDVATLEVRKKLELSGLTVTSAAAHPTRPLFALGGDSGATALVTERGELMALMVATSNGEYVTAAPDGAYRSSVDGARAAAWSFERPLEAFSFDQFSARFHRPEVIEQRLAGQLDAAVGDVARPPRICVGGAPLKTESGQVEIGLKVAGAREVASVRAFVNGRLAVEKPVGDDVADVSLTVPVGTGKSRVSLFAYDRDGYASNPGQVDVVSTLKAKRPDLHVITLGVSQYPELSAGQQLEFADDDARAVASALAKQGGGLFGEVHVTTLVDAEVTVDAASRAIATLEHMGKDDLAVIFLAGHGIRIDGGEMVFLTSGAALTHASARANGLGWKRLGGLLAKAKGRVLVLLDACHSGHVTVDQVAANDALAAALAAGDRGGVFVFAASRGAQPSYEVAAKRGTPRGLELAWEGAPTPKTLRPAREGHGLFTSAVLEALAGGAPDPDGSGALELSELVDYVTERVRGSSNGKQTPWVARREMFGDYAIAPTK